MNTPTLPPAAPNSKLTWPEVVRDAIREMPALVLIAIVGIMALKGEAKATEVVMTLFGFFTYKSSPTSVLQKGALPGAIIGAVFIFSHLGGCAVPQAVASPHPVILSSGGGIQ